MNAITHAGSGCSRRGSNQLRRINGELLGCSCLQWKMGLSGLNDKYTGRGDNVNLFLSLLLSRRLTSKFMPGERAVDPILSHYSAEVVVPEEMEVPTEHLHEDMEHAAHHSSETWIMFVALSSALLAVLAAACSLLAGHHANEAMIEQIQASDQWAYYQAKGIKSTVLESKMELLRSLGKEPEAKDGEKITEYKNQQKEIEDKAHEKEQSSEQHLALHQILAKGVTVFQIAIALGAISALSRRKWLWYVSLALGALGLLFFLQGIL